jgi:ribosomal protein S27AE
MRMAPMIDDKFLDKIDTVHGHCPECGDETILIAIVTDYYRCTSCGEDTRQYVNGSIKYLKLTEEDHKWLKKQKDSASTITSKEKK